MADPYKNLEKIISDLWDRLDREPTEDEVYDFIFGDDNARQTIWNKNKENKEHG